MIIEDKVAEILEDAGFLSAFTDFKGNPQPAPKLQLINLDEEGEEDRFFFIRETGSAGGNVFVQRVGVSIFFLGLKTKSDTPVVKDYADRVLTYLLEPQQNCGIIDIDPTSGSLSVMFTDLGRPIVEIQTTVLLDRGLN